MPDPSPIDWAAELRRAGEAFGLAPRRFNWFRRLALRIPRPKWLTDPAARPELHAIVAQQAEIWRDGEVVWGALITADDAAFRPGVDDLAAVALYSFDPNCAANLLGLVQAAAQIANMITQTNLSESPSFKSSPEVGQATPAAAPHALPILQQITQPAGEAESISPRARLKANLASPSRYEVPKALTAGITMFATTVLARRLHLPRRRITNGYFPLVIRRDCPEALILPNRYWPETVLEDWQHGA